MMRIKVLSAKKIQNKFIQDAIKEYAKRLTKYCRIDLKTTSNIEKEIRDKDYIIKISKTGESISSEQLAEKISSLGVSGNSDIAMVVDDEYNVAKPDFNLGISNMDIDGDLMLIILYEQIYRAYRIINNEPYHK